MFERLAHRRWRRDLPPQSHNAEESREGRGRANVTIAAFYLLSVGVGASVTSTQEFS